MIMINNVYNDFNDRCGHAVNYEVTGDSATGCLPDCPLNEEKCPVSQYKGIEACYLYIRRKGE